MAIIRKIKTGFKVLFSEGPNAFIKAGLYSLRSNLAGSTGVEESKIAFQALHADQNTGLMIDVGAHHGFGLQLFLKHGWQVYAFEPDSENRTVLHRKFSGLPNLFIDPRAVSDHPQEKMTLYKSQHSTGMSGLSSFHPSHTAAEEVEVTTLSHFFMEQGINNEEVQFLKVDTEGFDLFVLKGIPWDKTAPLLILCEFEDSKTLPLGYSFHDLASYLLDHGYHLIVSEWYPIQKYGGLHRWKRFSTYPCELGNARSWGNILAARDSELYQNLLDLCNISN
jgi:FkbM family methyltransferase